MDIFDFLFFNLLEGYGGKYWPGYLGYVPGNLPGPAEGHRLHVPPTAQRRKADAPVGVGFGTRRSAEIVAGTCELALSRVC